MRLKFKSLQIFVIAFSAILFFSCAGGNKLSSKQLTFSDLLTVHDEPESKVVVFMSKKGWTNTTAADRKSDEIDEDEQSWSLRKDARSPKIAMLTYYDDDWGCEVTYATESKESFNQLLSQAKAYNKPVYKQCTDKSHLKSGTIHYYGEGRDVYFTPATGSGKWYTVSIVEEYW
jgi:hypothetical protein